MARNQKRRRDGQQESDPKTKDLECFLNQPNINMVIPWIYEIYKNMATSRSRDGGSGDEDKVEKDLQCFLNQPNINMVIPWIYGIYRSVKDGGGSSGGSEIVSDLKWDDLT